MDTSAPSIESDGMRLALIRRFPLPTHRPLRILLVKPDNADAGVGLASLARVPPLELLTVAATVPMHDVRVLDARLETPAGFAAALREFHPDVVGLTAYTADAHHAKSLCRFTRQLMPDVTIIQGGYHATMAPDDALANGDVDFLVLGEAEVTFPELLAALQAGEGFDRVPGIATSMDGTVVESGPRDQIVDLDASPFPAWEKVAQYRDRYYLSSLGTVVTMETTRGCPYSCSFCAVWKFHRRRYRKKSVDRVMEELARLPPAQITGFVDDEFWVDADRSLAIADRLLRRTAEQPAQQRFWAQTRTSDIARTPELVRRWAAAGMKVLLIGFETHKEQELSALHEKRSSLANTEVALDMMRRHGLEAWGCFIVNPDWETEDFRDLEAFVRRGEIAFPQFTVMTPLPGTVLTSRLLASGKLRLGDMHTQLLDCLHAVTPTKLPLRQFYENLARLYRRTGVHQQPGLFRRALRNGAVSSEWLRSDTSATVRSSYGRFLDPEAYLRGHRQVGQVT